MDLVRVVEMTAQRPHIPVWLVGGPVRDTLLHRSCHDWDFVCRRARSFTQAAARTLHAKRITLDEQYRIYRLILAGGVTLDFAELQGRSIEEDLSRRDFTINAMAMPLVSLNRHSPRLLAGNPWIPCQGPQGMTTLIDPFNGRRDLKRKVVRAVSEKALVDDPLRLLRAFRFAAQFGFKIESRTLQWIKKHGASLTLHPLPRGEGRVRGVAAERIREELLKLLTQPHAGTALRQMDRVRLLAHIFPEIEACRRTAIRYYGKGGVLKHSFQTVENLEWIFERILIQSSFPAAAGGESIMMDPRQRHSGMTSLMKNYLNTTVGGYPRLAWLKLAAFLHDIGKPATARVIQGRLRFFEHEHVGAASAMKIGQRLRCSRQESQLLGLWVRNHMRPGNLAAAPRITDKALSRFFRDLGEDGVGMVLLSLADHYTYLSPKLWGKGKDAVEKISLRLLAAYYQERSKILPERLVDGNDLMRKLRLKPGPLIGRLLEDIQDAQAEGKVTTREEALVFARKQIAQSGKRKAQN